MIGNFYRILISSIHMPLAIVLVLIIALGGAFYYRSTNDEVADESTSPKIVEEVKQNQIDVSVVSSRYTDGTYTKTGTYTSPAGSETVVVSVVLENDVVKSATFTGQATNPGSKLNQGKFSAGFSNQVVGKPIDDISLTVVNGSSLTPKGFMNALTQIKAEARI